jgi:alpha-tubulin suppressor-like RCC1 family protein
LWTWGSGSFGTLGLGNTTSYSSPKQVGSLTNWSAISIGQGAMMALKTDGTLWAWGQNNVGQLGLSNRTYYSSPKQVGALTTWSSISCGSVHSSYAIKTDGTFWVWGDNSSYGQLGLGNTTSYSSPKQVGSLTNWLKVSGGRYRALAIKTDGTMWSWGYGAVGSLGLGNSTYYSSPKQIGALTTWASVSGGALEGYAIKTDGTLWSWGYNGQGQLGTGNTTNYSSPVQVGLLTSWLRVAGSGYSTAAVKTDKTLWSWGQNDIGQLGLGTSGPTSTYKSSPTQVGSLTNWFLISSIAYGAPNGGFIATAS